ncbi:MAG TPA: YceI family protein [Streptosporangiaceae bacterium]|nr:YceI family protein [Streptosporangiaceae bacterium]
MQAPPGQLTGSALRALLTDGTLAGDWILDQRRSSVRLKSRSVWGLAPVNGVFREVSGSGTVSRNGSASGVLTVAAASIDTRNTQRDTHLRSADFFDSATYPDIAFTVNGIEPSGAGIAVPGALTVRGRTRPLSFDIAASVPGDGEIWLDAEVRVNRADFGLTWNRLGMVSPTTAVTIHAVFTRR